MAGQQRGRLRERLRFAPVFEDARPGHVWARDRDTGCQCADRFAVARDLFLIALCQPRCFAQPVARIRVRLVADLHARQKRAEVPARRRHLVGGGLRVVVREVDRQEHPPTAAAREFADGAHLRRADRERCPGWPWLGPFGPGDVLICGDATEADHARPERAQHRDKVAAVGIAGDLAQRGRLEREAEKVGWDRLAGLERIDDDADGHRGLRGARGGLRRRRAGDHDRQQHGEHAGPRGRAGEYGRGSGPPRWR